MNGLFFAPDRWKPTRRFASAEWRPAVSAHGQSAKLGCLRAVISFARGIAGPRRRSGSTNQIVEPGAPQRHAMHALLRQGLPEFANTMHFAGIFNIRHIGSSLPGTGFDDPSNPDLDLQTLDPSELAALLGTDIRPSDGA